jgi:hypothetical protein
MRPRRVRYQAALRPDYDLIINALADNGLRVTFVTLSNTDSPKQAVLGL